MNVFSDPIKPLRRSIWPGGNLKLLCPSPSNWSKTHWEQNGTPLTPAARLQFLQDGLLILNASQSDTGLYRCLSVEHSKAGKYTSVVTECKVDMVPTSTGNGYPLLPKARTDGPSVVGLQAVLGLLVVALLALLAWNFHKGHIPLPWNCRKNKEASQEPGGLNYQEGQRSGPTEDKPLVSGRDNGTGTNLTRAEAALYAADESDAPELNLPSLQFIDDE